MKHWPEKARRRRTATCPDALPGLTVPSRETDAGIRLHLARRAAVPEAHAAADDSATKDRNASPSQDSADRKQLLLLDLDGTADTETLTKLRTTLSAQGLDISIAAPGPETMPTADGSWQIALDRLTGTEIPRTLQDVAANGLVLVGGPWR